nr:PaaX family transcriptional regulator C-terminal domain-containing protein [Rhodococcus wratislaviensis]GLK40037.1 phenylacetic acid degradation operon negative regulatory protein PaaX [Rhodococcus wratislaviensis]
MLNLVGEVIGQPVRMNRMEAMNGSQQLLTSILGSYFMGVNSVIPSSFFVSVMRDFDLSETATRNAVSRASRQGLLVPSRHGRQTFYSLSESAHERHQYRLKQIVDYGREPVPWDGRWTVVTFSVEESQRNLRHQLRQHLRQLGFGLLHDGVWVVPRTVEPDALAQLLNVGVPRLTVFSGPMRTAGTAAGDPMTAFAVEEMREKLVEFSKRAADIVDALEDDSITPTTALRLRVEVLRDWRVLGDEDPQLPTELLGADWPLPAARSLFERVYDDLASAAEERLRHHLSSCAPQLADSIGSLSTAEVAALELVQSVT